MNRRPDQLEVGAQGHLGSSGGGWHLSSYTCTPHTWSVRGLELATLRIPSQVHMDWATAAPRRFHVLTVRCDLMTHHCHFLCSQGKMNSPHSSCPAGRMTVSQRQHRTVVWPSKSMPRGTWWHVQLNARCMLLNFSCRGSNCLQVIAASVYYLS